MTTTATALPRDYQRVPSGHLIQEGDILRTGWELVHITFGGSLIGHPVGHHIVVRPTHPENDKPHTHRILHDWEELPAYAGAEYWNPEKAGWVPFSYPLTSPAGFIHRAPLGHPSYRVITMDPIVPGDDIYVNSQWERVPGPSYGQRPTHPTRRPFIQAYRILEVGEVLQEGDQLVQPNGSHFTLPVGHTLVGVGVDKSASARRRHTPKADPGEGFRLLHAGEETLDSDDYWSPTISAWAPLVVRDPDPVHASVDDLLDSPYRRRLSPAPIGYKCSMNGALGRVAAVKPLPGWYLLAPGDDVKAGDAYWGPLEGFDPTWYVVTPNSALLHDQAVRKILDDLVDHPYIRANEPSVADVLVSLGITTIPAAE